MMALIGAIASGADANMSLLLSCDICSRGVRREESEAS